MSFPLMDTLNSAMFRLSLDELVDLERKRRTGNNFTGFLQVAFFSLKFEFVIFWKNNISAKGARTCWLHLTTAVNCTNILRTAFCSKELCTAFLYLEFGFEFFFSK